MLKTSGSTESKTQPGEGKVRVGNDSKVGRGRSEINGSGMDDVEVNDSKVEVNEIEKKVQKLSKSKNLPKSKETIRSSDFLIPGAKLVFTKLRQVFLKAPIFHHIDPEHHVRIETDVSGYATGGVWN